MGSIIPSTMRTYLFILLINILLFPTDARPTSAGGNFDAYWIKSTLLDISKFFFLQQTNNNAKWVTNLACVAKIIYICALCAFWMKTCILNCLYELCFSRCTDHFEASTDIPTKIAFLAPRLIPLCDKRNTHAFRQYVCYWNIRSKHRVQPLCQLVLSIIEQYN